MKYIWWKTVHLTPFALFIIVLLVNIALLVSAHEPHSVPTVYIISLIQVFMMSNGFIKTNSRGSIGRGFMELRSLYKTYSDSILSKLAKGMSEWDCYYMILHPHLNNF